MRSIQLGRRRERRLSQRFARLDAEMPEALGLAEIRDGGRIV